MKKLIALSFVVAAGVAASFVFATNVNETKNEESAKIPPCRASYYTCPDGSQSLKCNRKSSIVHPTCTQADQNGWCEIILPCR